MSDEDEDDDLITVGILWTTTGMRPYVSIAIKSDMIDDERQRILHDIAEHVRTGRKRQGDDVEETLGRNVEDYVMVKCNAMHFAMPSDKNIIAPPAMVRWLRKTLPAAGIIPAPRLKIEVVWMEPGTIEAGKRKMHPQP